MKQYNISSQIKAALNSGFQDDKQSVCPPEVLRRTYRPSRQNYIHLIFLFFSFFTTTAQNTVTLNQPEGDNKIYVAKEGIKMQQGYSFKAESNKSVLGYIDPTIVGNVEYTGSISSNTTNRQINTSFAVGSTAGSAGVSGSGGATYSIPLMLPPGTNGMVPTLSVNYNSQGGNGILGMGWGLSGLSAITRTGKTIYHNGKVEGIKSTNDDVFTMDGARLIPTAGNNGIDGTTYATEIESFSRITSHGTLGNGPSWFEVETKDGKKLQYGPNDSRMLNTNGTALVWYLYRVIDLNGNYIEYKYRTVEGEALIDEILYTGNTTANLLPYNKVKFMYDGRIDDNTVYLDGKEINQKVKIDQIRITTEQDLLVKAYLFSYTYHTYSHLVEVQEMGADGTKLNATVFDYGTPAQEITMATSNFLLQNEHQNVFPGDYTGDGFPDLLVAELNASSPMVEYTGVTLYQNNVDGTFSNLCSESFGGTSGSTPFYTGKDLENIFTSDYNGDGKEDFMTVSRESSLFDGYTFVMTNIRIYYSTGTSFTHEDFSPAGQASIANNSGFLYSGDFDGDGATDFITLLKTTSQSSTYEVWMYFPRRHETKQITDLSNADISRFTNGFSVSITDIDGDGKNELTSTGVAISTVAYEFSYNGTSVSSELIMTSSFPSNSAHLWHGDFNGDGKTDVLSYENSVWKIGYSTGEIYNPVSVNLAGISVSTGVIKVGDYNGDGKTDINYLYHPYSGSPAHSIVWYSNGNGFEYPHDNNLGTGLDLTGLRSGDFNADGRMDELCFSYGYSTPIIHYNKDDKSLLLARVSDGFNNLSEFIYTSMMNTAVYTRPNGYSYPFHSIRVPMYLVSSFKQPDGVGGINESIYKYEEAIIHKQGRGFLGFKKTIISNALSNRKVVSTSLFDQNHVQLLPEIREVYKISPNTQLSKSTSYYTFSSLVSNRWWIYANKSESTDYVSGVTQCQRYVYNNNYGNLDSSISTILVGTTEKQKVTTVNSYVQIGTWIPAHLESTSTVSKRGTETSPTITKTFTYDNSGKLSTYITYPNNELSVKTENITYDVFGNVTEQKISAPKATDPLQQVVPISTKVFYDDKGRFVVKKQNALQQIESQFAYDPRFGKQTQSVDLLGLVTKYSYDGFGRLTTTEFPTGAIGNNTMAWDIKTGSNSAPGDITAVFYALTEGTAMSYAKTWYDSFGREKMTKVDGAEPTYAVKIYNNKGQVTQTTNPYFASQSPQITMYDYFDDGRINHQIDAIGTTTYAYTFNATTGELESSVTTPANHTTKKVVDATGLNTKAADAANGELIYIYDALGRMTEVKNGTQNLVKMTYDIAGNKISMKDVNLDTIHYTYNAFGQLVHQRQEMGDNSIDHESTMKYDGAGRITKKTSTTPTSGNKITNYEYNTEGKGINQISKITEPQNNNYEQSFGYGDYGRMLRATEVIDGETFNTYYTYNNIGQQTKVTYPGGFATKNFYNSLGEMYKITNETEDKVLWEQIEKNNYGQYTKYRLANGVTTVKSYDSLGFLTNTAAVGIQNLSTVFEHTTGNLESRKDHLIGGANGTEETFAYDNLNRLETVTLKANGATTPTLNMSYAANGNIQNKSDVGNYTYDSGKINAVVSVQQPGAGTTVIDSTLQNITYTTFNKASTIKEGEDSLALYYGADAERRKAIFLHKTGNDFQITATRYYLSGYEKTMDDNTTIEVNYVGSPDGLVALMVKTNDTAKYYCVYTDHLGTPVTITDIEGQIEYKQSFDAWGKRRNPETWEYDTAYFTQHPAPKWLYRGYTGHEHLDQFELINMNGRMYDPTVARMLSPDNYIQEAGFSQSYNRYSYVWNNPLKYTDPTGNITWADVISGAEMVAGAVLIGISWGTLGTTAFLGGTLFSHGFTHFAVTIDQYEVGVPWDQASKDVGFTLGYNGPGNLSGSGNSPSVNQQKMQEIDELFDNYAVQASTTSQSNQLDNQTGQYLTPEPISKEGTFDLSRGYGANGTNSTNSTLNRLSATYVGMYHGAFIYESPMLGGSNGSGGVTLPPLVIIVGVGAYSQNLFPALLQHEYGHILQARVLGSEFFYSVIATQSAVSASLNGKFGHLHSNFWTETTANDFSKVYFGNQYISSPKFPTNH